MPKNQQSGSGEGKSTEQKELRPFYFPTVRNGVTINAASQEEATEIVEKMKQEDSSN